MPRCPQCTYLVRQLAASGVCAVCASGCTVQRIESTVQQAWSIDLILRTMFRPPTRQGAARVLSRCEEPGCTGEAWYTEADRKRLATKGHLARSQNCRTTKAVSQRYQARHQPPRQEGG